MSAGAELSRVVDVYLQLRQIGECAFALKLQALNAIAVTVSRASSSRGFREVASQMGTLSQSMFQCTTDLQQLAGRWVHLLSQELALEQRTSLMRQAASHTPAAQEALAVLEADLQRLAEELRRFRDRLSDRLHDSKQLSAMGSVVSRTAKLEATYGGDAREMLALVSEQFAIIADQVYGSITALSRAMDSTL